MKAALAALAATLGALVLAPPASADQGHDFDAPNCETVPTGSLVDQFGYRTICDGAASPTDGGWNRRYVLWGKSNRFCNRNPLGMRRCMDMDSAPRIYHIDERVVFPDAIPPGEPGHLG